MGSKYAKRPLWGVVGFTLLLALVGPYLLLNTFLGDNRTKYRALLAGGLPSETPVPRDTPTQHPSPTAATTAFEISTPTPTAIAPGSNFDGAFVSGVTWLESGETMVRIVVPNGVAGIYRAEVETSRSLEYACLIPEGYEDRIYCIGSRLARGSLATIQIYHRASPERLVFGSEFLVIEVLPTPTPTPTPVNNSPSSSGTDTPTPSGSQTATPLASPSETSLPTSTLVGPTTSPVASSATPSTPAPTQTTTPTPAPTDEPPEQCKGPDHPVFPCTETPAPSPTDPPTSAPELTQEPIPTP